MADTLSSPPPPRREGRLGVLALAGLALWAGYTLCIGGHWWMQGNIHDLFMVLPAAHFFGDGAGAGSEFHTSFGWLYPVLHRAAWWLVAQSPRLDLGAIPLLTGVIFSFVFLGLYAAVRAFLRPWMRLPWWGAALLLTLVLTPRHLALKPPLYMLWYSLYNHHLWACWLLQLLLVLGWRKRLDAEPAPSICALRRLGVLQAAFLYLGLHYKLSFFLAAGGLVLVPCCAMPWRAGRNYLLWTAAFLLGAMLLTAGAGYDYRAYLTDLIPAFHAKDIHKTNKACSFAAAFLFLCLLGAEGLARHAQAKRSGMPMPWLPFIGRGTVHLLVIGSAWLASMSNYSQVPLFLFLAAGLLVWLEPDLRAAQALPIRAMRWGLLAIGLVAVGMNLAGMADLAYHRTHAPMVAGVARDAHTFQSQSGRFRLSLWLPPETAAALPHNGTAQELVAGSIVSPHKAPGEPTPFGMNDAYNNRDYARFIEQGLALLHPFPGLGSARIGSLEFGNPFPLLAGTRYPTANLHWLHPGTTHAWRDMALVTRYYASSDLLLMPTANSDGAPQRLINCHFLRWNAAAGHPFHAVGAEPYVLLYAADAWRAAHSVPQLPIPAAQETGMLEACHALEEEALGLHPPVGDPPVRALP